MKVVETGIVPVSKSGKAMGTLGRLNACKGKMDDLNLRHFNYLRESEDLIRKLNLLQEIKKLRAQEVDPSDSKNVKEFKLNDLDFWKKGGAEKLRALLPKYPGRDGSRICRLIMIQTRLIPALMDECADLSAYLS